MKVKQSSAWELKARMHASTLLAVTMLAGGCTNGSTNGAHPQPMTAAAEGKVKEEAPPPKPDTPVSEVGATRFTDFPAVSLDGLSAYQKAAFTQLANEEICPCDCPKSWAACLQAETKCQPAVLLAEWTINQLASGVEAEILAEQITAEIGAFTSRPKKVNVSGYASKGSSRPKYTVIEYADFECAHCKAASSTMSELIDRRGNDVKLIYKHYPLSFHPMARKAAEAVEAASRQGKFWEMHDAVFATQTMLDEDLLVGHARALGLNVPQFEQDLISAEVVQKVSDSHKEGETIGVEATPTFLVNNRPFNLMRTLEAFELRFAMEDARSSSSCQ